MYKKILFVVGFVFIFITISGCKQKKKTEVVYTDQILWSWNEDQNCLGQENIWNGFKNKKGRLKIIAPIARLAFWRNSVPSEFTISYFMGENTEIRIFVNSRVAGYLSTSSKPVRETIRSDFFQKGLNFIEFRAKGGRNFYIENICVGKRNDKGSNFVIEAGEKLYIPIDGEKVYMKIAGRGKVLMKVFQGKKSHVILERKISNYKRTSKVIKFKYNGPSLVEISGISGKLKILKLKIEKTGKNKNEIQKAPSLRFKRPFPDIYVFLIDACQASHLGIYGYHRNTSPNIDRFARDSVIFENAYTNAAFTRASIASLFTGLYPEHHKVRVLRDSIPKNFLTIPLYLKGKGYTTSIFTASANISRKFGFTKGVDEYFAYFGSLGGPLKKKMERDFLKWIKKHPSPKFSYLHFMEPHFPIIPPPPFKNMFKLKVFEKPVMNKLRKKEKFTPREVQDVVDDYDSTIAYIDSILGRIWEYMRMKDYYDKSLIIFLSDHGEGLYEHKYFGHGHKVYEEVTRIPLIVKFPSYMKLKGRVSALVQVIDIFPTIIELFGDRKALDGRSLLAAFAQKGQDGEFTISRNFLNPGSYGVRWKNYYYILNLDGFEEELFDLNQPRRDISQKERVIVLYLRSKLLKWLKKYNSILIKPRKVNLRKTLSEKELKNLKSLGYIK